MLKSQSLKMLSIANFIPQVLQHLLTKDTYSTYKYQVYTESYLQAHKKSAKLVWKRLKQTEGIYF